MIRVVPPFDHVVPPLDSPRPLDSLLPSTAPDAAAPWLVPSRTCWRQEHATRLAFLVDGADFFGAVRSALANAQHSFYILGWDINSAVKLCPEGAGDGLPDALGPFLNALVKRREGLQGHVLGWDYAMLYALEREWWSRLRFRSRRLAFEMDARHPLGASHHQKVIVIDDRVAFVSGFDLAPCRWDTAEHACENPLRTCAGKSYGPFHDVGAIVEGDVAQALGELCRERWTRGTGKAPAAPAPVALPSPWPATVAADIEDIEVAIARTAPAFEGDTAITEVRELYLDAIARARRFVFGENQYFTSSIVAKAMAARLGESDGPELALLVPANESGWIETSTMGVLRARVHARLRAADVHGRYGLYCPRHSCDEPHPVCINVHSKVLVVDDELLTVGSANLSDRSMCYDTECNLAIEARGDPRIRALIAGLRVRLLGEHLGVSPAAVLAATQDPRDAAAGSAPSLHAAIASLTDRHRRYLDPIEPQLDPTLDAVLPSHDVIDPAEPLDAEVLIADMLPRKRSRKSVQARVAFGVVGILVVAALALAWRHALPATPDAVAEIASLTQAWQGSPWIAVALLAAYVVGGFVLVPLTLLIAVTAALFGPVVGIPLALTGALASGALTFALGRRLERGVVRRITGRRFDTLARRLEKRGLLAVLIVRLLPVAPYSIVNVAAGVARIGWRDFLLGTVLGLLPGIVLTSAFIDRALAALAEPSAGRMAALGGVLAVIVAMGWALHRKFDGRLAS